MNITKADVGRKVILTDGSVRTIDRFDGSSVPVRLKPCGGGHYYATGSAFCIGSKDIARFAPGLWPLISQKDIDDGVEFIRNDGQRTRIRGWRTLGRNHENGCVSHSDPDGVWEYHLDGCWDTESYDFYRSLKARAETIGPVELADGSQGQVKFADRMWRYGYDSMGNPVIWGEDGLPFIHSGKPAAIGGSVQPRIGMVCRNRKGEIVRILAHVPQGMEAYSNGFRYVGFSEQNLSQTFREDGGWGMTTQPCDFDLVREVRA